VSCPFHDPDPSYVNIYPSDTEIPGYGTLAHIETLWDGKNKGKDVFYATEAGDDIWVYARDNISFYVNKGFNRTSANTKRLDDTVSWWFSPMRIIANGNYLLLFTYEVEYEPVSKEKYYINRININNQKLQKFDISNFMNYKRSANIEIYYDNNNVFLVPGWWDHENEIYLTDFYILNNGDDQVGLNEITEEDFNSFLSQNNNNIYMTAGGEYRQFSFSVDENSIYYRVLNGFEISLDKGITWQEVDMGTNTPTSVIVQGNFLYVFCGPETKWVSVWGTKSVGGGIHVFQWR